MKSLNRISTLSSELPTIDRALFKGHQPSGLQSKYYESAPCNARLVQKPLKRKTIDTKDQQKKINENILVFRRTAHLCWRLEKNLQITHLERNMIFQTSIIMLCSILIFRGVCQLICSQEPTKAGISLYVHEDVRSNVTSLLGLFGILSGGCETHWNPEVPEEIRHQSKRLKWLFFMICLGVFLPSGKGRDEGQTND